MPRCGVTEWIQVWGLSCVLQTTNLVVLCLIRHHERTHCPRFWPNPLHDASESLYKLLLVVLFPTATNLVRRVERSSKIQFHNIAHPANFISCTIGVQGQLSQTSNL